MAEGVDTEEAGTEVVEEAAAEEVEDAVSCQLLARLCVMHDLCRLVVSADVSSEQSNVASI